jgi:hypothetical protein
MIFWIIYFGLGIVLAPFNYALNRGYWCNGYDICPPRTGILPVFATLVFFPFILVSLYGADWGKHGLKWRH